jgi:tryptophan 7-halogenase
MSEQRIRRVVIAGGGSAGWMTAAGMTRLLRRKVDEIVLVESSEIGTVGVGEATLPTIRFFNASLGLDEIDFIRRTDASFKLGIEFLDWSSPGRSFFHGFSDFGPPVRGISAHQLWLKTRSAGDETSYENFSITSTAARLNRFAPPLPNRDSVLGSYSYGFHFDATLYAAYLRGYAESRGVRRIDARIVDVRLRAENGHIEELVLDDGRKLGGDLFIDCSGFASLLIGRALQAEFEDWSRWLPCNRAFAVPCESGGDGLTPYTRSTARKAGWQWRIPLQHRVGNGHVFCDAFTTEEEARDTLLANLDGKPLADPRLIKFTTGRRRAAWTKNCVAVGLSCGFLEPLESTSLHLIEIGVGRLIELFPDRDIEPRLADEYNRLMSRSFESIRDFIILHYHASQRDEELWRHCRSMAIPDALRHQLELFRAGGQVALYDSGAFAEPSWVSIYFGQRIWPRRHDPMADLIADTELDRELERRRRIVEGAARSLSEHRQFIGRFCQAQRPA